MLIEAIDCRLILNQNFNGLFAGKIDRFAGRDLCTRVIYKLALLLGIQRRIKTQVFFSLDKVPIELDAIVCSLIESVVSDLEERTLDGSHQTAASSN